MFLQNQGWNGNISHVVFSRNTLTLTNSSISEISAITCTSKGTVSVGAAGVWVTIVDAQSTFIHI